MPFHNQPITLVVPAKATCPPQFGATSILLRYARAPKEPAYVPRIVGAYRSDDELFGRKRADALFELEEISASPKDQIFLLTFAADQVQDRGKQKALYAAILDRSVITLEIAMAAKDLDEDECEKAYRKRLYVASLRLKLEPKLGEQ